MFSKAQRTACADEVCRECQNTEQAVMDGFEVVATVDVLDYLADTDTGADASASGGTAFNVIPPKPMRK